MIQKSHFYQFEKDDVDKCDLAVVVPILRFEIRRRQNHLSNEKMLVSNRCYNAVVAVAFLRDVL